MLQAKKIVLHEEMTQNKLQIVHCAERNHWTVATTLGCEKDTVKVYDSMYHSVDECTKAIILNLFQSSELRPVKIKILCPQKQDGTSNWSFWYSLCYFNCISRKKLSSRE